MQYFANRKVNVPSIVLIISLFFPPLDNADIGADGKVLVNEKTFDCIQRLSPIRGFYVGNLLGNLKGSLAVTNSNVAGVYPPGTIVQLVPTEAMIKQPAGYNAAT